MRPSKAHYVTSCQQLLALGAVLAVLAPAASVLSLDVVGTPGTTAPEAARTQPGPGAALPGAHTRRDAGNGGTERLESASESTVPVGTVEPTVTEVPLTPADSDEAKEREPRPAARAGRERVVPPEPKQPADVPRTTVVSEPEPVEGYGAVGVTWSSEEQVDHEDIVLEVRTSTRGMWGEWTDLEYHEDHGPTPGSAEGRNARPGTDPLLVGEVDLVQVRAVADQGLPEDMSLAVVAPGEASAVAKESPELIAGQEADGAAATDQQADDGLELQAARRSAAPQPRIFSRKQWGANERLRDGRPSYGTISAGFVHHTVNANDYTRADVPRIIRSIYAYHTQSRGWSDIGYNFLVDKFGRIWEGRYGGIARPVIGAHTYGYNDDAFAMSAIGNFETVRPPDVMLRAYGALFAWKLGLHGVDPMDRSQNVSGSTLKAINGHRDAGSTACPGRYLYARLPAIRTYAANASAQEPAPERISVKQVDSNLAAGPHPDLVVRRASDGRGLILPTGGLTWFSRPQVVNRRWGTRNFLTVPDLTGDGRVDVATFDRTGAMEIRPGRADGGVGRVARRVKRFRGHDLVASAGFVDRGRRPDFVARARGRLVTFLGTRRGGVRRVAQDVRLRGYRQLVGAGDVTGDGRADLWGVHRRGRLYVHRGLGRGRFSSRVRVAGSWSGYDWFVGGVDYTGDSRPDLLARRNNGFLMIFPSREGGTLGSPIGPVRRMHGLSSIGGAGQVAGGDPPDLLATRSDGTLVVLRNRGSYDLGAPIDTGRSFSRGDLLINAGDITGDGHGDVIMRRRVGSLWLYRGDGTGRLAAPTSIGGRHFRVVSDLRVVADVTDDGRPDLLGRRDGKATVWPGNGDGTWAKAYVVRIGDDPASKVDRAGYDWLIEVTDLQRRGVDDVVVRRASGELLRLDGTRRGFRAPRNLGGAEGYDLGG